MRGATDGVVVPLLGDGISIHAPRAGRDREMVAIRAYVHCIFQSTRPVRGATDGVVVPLLGDGISIHAPRAGRD